MGTQNRFDRATERPPRRHTMKSALALLALLACMTAQASAEPWFYHGLEGPAFTTESNSTSGYEVCRYISGDNELKQKIEMTVPALASVIPGQGPFCEENFTYHFSLPAEFQSNPPKPSDPRVENVVLPPLTVAVASYDGWSNEQKVITHGRDLFQDLTDANVKFNSEMFYTAGYDSPFRLIDRHNEVWVSIQDDA